jgi:hypothetical protein
MKRILVIYYSQSGEVARAAESFVRFLDTPQFETTWERIEPRAHYPYPWKSVYQFFDVFPECVNQEPPEIHPPTFDPDDKFDLIILAYQVWFLAPSLPVQSFLKSEYARVFNNTPVITLVVCRGMWHSASETMKKMIAEVGGIHIDNVVVTHQGPALATFITTPRLLLTGSKDRFLGIFPKGGTHETEIESLERFGKTIAANPAALNEGSQRSLLKGLGAVEINAHYVALELVGQFVYKPWAKAAQFFGPARSWQRRPIIYLFIFNLVVFLPWAIPITMISRLLLHPLINRKFESYVHRLRSPSGVA